MIDKLTNIRDRIKNCPYYRKSTERDERQATSIRDQKTCVLELCESLKINVIKQYEEAKSAKKPDIRVEFYKLLNDVEQGRCNAITVWQPNRLSRNALDAGRIIQLMDDKKLLAVITPNKIYINTPEDKADLQNKFTSSKEYSDVLSVDVTRGLKQKALHGYTTGKPKAGYKNIQVDITDENESRYETIQVVDETRFPLLRKAFDKYLTGNYTVPEVLDYLNNELGYRTKKTKRTGGKPLSDTQLYTIFKDPYYYGKFSWGSNENKIETEVNKSLPRLITENEYWQVQKILGKKGKPRPRAQSEVKAPFRGIINCAECNSKFVPYRQFKRLANGENKASLYYKCSHSYKTNLSCTQKQLPITKLDNQVIKILNNIEIPKVYFDWAMKQLKEEYKEDKNINKIAIDNLNKELHKIEKQQERLLELTLASETLKTEEFDDNKKRLEEKADSIRQQLISTQESQDNWIEEAEKTFEFALNAKNKYKNGDIKTKSIILNSLGDSIKLLDQTLLIDLHKPYLRFKENHELLNAYTEPFELGESGLVTSNVGASNHQNQLWWTVPGSNR